MAFAITWNSTFDVGPAKTEKLGRAYVHINDVRVGMRERMALDHEFNVAENTSQGAHKEGSARAYYQAAAPNYAEQTNIPSQTTDLHSGRLWIDSTNKTISVQTLANANATGWTQIAQGGGYALSEDLTRPWTVYSLTADHEVELVIRKSRLATAANGVTVDDDYLGAIEWQGNSGTAFTTAARIQVRQDGTADATTPAEMIFTLGAGAASVTPLILNKDGSITVANGITLTAGGLTVPGAFVASTGATITAGGLTVTAGGITVTAGGLTVTEGDVVITDGDLTVTAGAFLPGADDSGALGAAATGWSDLFLASGGVLNWANGDVTVTHAADALAFAGASSGYSFDAALIPATDDAAALGSAALGWSDAFFAAGAVMTWGAPSTPDATLTHSANMLTLAGAGLTVPNLTLSSGTTGNVYSGAYTPTITNRTNVADSALYRAIFFRLGSRIRVTVSLMVNPTASGYTVVELSLPIASAIEGTDSTILGGSGSAYLSGVGVQAVYVAAYGTSDNAVISFWAAGTPPHDVTVTFDYTIV